MSQTAAKLWVRTRVSPSRAFLIAGIACGITVISGCGWFGGDQGVVRHRGPSMSQVLAELPLMDLPKAAPRPAPTRDEVMAAYNSVYGMLPNATENHAVGKRLADLHMQVGEDADIEGVERPYNAAVELYESLLDSTDGEKKDEILYQLARAYDVMADSPSAVVYLDRLIEEYPDSRYSAEVHFRRGEIAFSNADFRLASRHYGFVVTAGKETPYWLNASYMLGWSEFKRSELDAGLGHFFAVIDSISASAIGDTESLGGAEKELLGDTFRVVTLALGYLDGAKTLALSMQKLKKPSWQYLAYQHLADDYLERERYLDSVATWQTFIEHNGLDARAPAAHKGMIDTLIAADFPSEVRPKKEEYVVRYGVYSEFWSVHDKKVREGYLDTLKVYLVEVAKVAHAEAQAPKLREPARIAAYLKAAEWYEELVVTFPEDPQLADNLFLLGEVYTEAGEHGQAVAAYQRVVREFPEHDRANEASYAGILGLEQLVSVAPAEELELWQRLKIDAQIEFAILFSADERAPAVQIDAANSLFALEHFSQAVDLAANLLQTWPASTGEVQKTALLILGHGQFELQRFASAENAYLQLLRVALAADERDKVNERLLAAVYKQGEAAEAEGLVDESVHHYLRIAGLDAAAPLAAVGHFDAAAVIEGAGRTGEAATMLAQFRERYPNHELARDIDMRLAGLFESAQDWSMAAAEFSRLGKTAPDLDVRRQSQYRAAELYLQMDDVEAAIAHFRDYAHEWQDPKDQRMEAMDHLDTLYQGKGDSAKRRFWLARKIELHRNMGAGATQRATYLAAEAQYVLATDDAAAFAAIRLTHPLPKSLKKKQKALTKTVVSFENVAAYQVEEFATAATFHVADLYVALSGSIMDSDRPKNLSPLELEQYEVLLEEQAYPFEEQAIDLHQINMRRSWEGTYDVWVKKSFAALGRLMPARFDKQEVQVAYVKAIH